jgi:hypothetical protein
MSTPNVKALERMRKVPAIFPCYAHQLRFIRNGRWRRIMRHVLNLEKPLWGTLIKLGACPLNPLNEVTEWGKPQNTGSKTVCLCESKRYGSDQRLSQVQCTANRDDQSSVGTLKRPNRTTPNIYTLVRCRDFRAGSRCCSPVTTERPKRPFLR